MAKNQAVWMRVVTVTSAVIAILVSALAMSPEIDRRVLPSQLAVASVAGAAVVDSNLAQSEPAINCHIGHSCSVTIMLPNVSAFAHFYGAREFPRIEGYQSSGAVFPLFHPPRDLSQG